MATLRERSSLHLKGDITVKVTYNASRMRAQYLITDSSGQQAEFTVRNAVHITVRAFMRRFPGFENWDGYMDTPEGLVIEMPGANWKDDVLEQTIRIEQLISPRAPYRLRLNKAGFWNMPQDVVDGMKNKFSR